MAQRVFPVDAVTGAPSYSGRAVRQALLAPLLAGATAGRPLGATSGVRPGTSTTTVTVAAMVWSVAPHAGILDVQAAVEAGPYGYALDAAVTGPVTAAHATLARWDGVYIQLSDPAESDGTSVPGVAAIYVAGTAAASPAMPATPARSMLLARIVVPASGGGSPSVVWLAPSLATGSRPDEYILGSNVTPGGSAADVGLSATVISPGTTAVWKVVVDLDAEVILASIGTLDVTLQVDGVTQAVELVSSSTDSMVGFRLPLAKTWRVTGLAAGSRVVKIRALTLGTNAWRLNATHSHMLVQRVG